MNILQLSPRLPYPLTDGGAIQIFHIVKAASERGHAVTFVTYPLDSSELTAEGVAELSKYSQVHIVSKRLPSRPLTLIKTLFRGSYPIERRMMPEMFALIDSLLRSEHFDIIHLDHSHMGKYGMWIKERYDLPVIVRQHNFENLIYKRFAERISNPLKRAFVNMHGNRLEREEIEILAKMDAVLAITEHDASLMRAVVPTVPYFVLPAGVDIHYFRPIDRPQIPESIFWIGGTGWEPNLDALDYFVREILPSIVQRIPNLRFHLAGEGTDKLKIPARFEQNVRRFGRVDDVRPYMAECKVMIVPLRIGGGIRVKLLEFFAMGKAVVSTPIGAEGNLARDGEEVILRENPLKFADAVVDLLQDDSKTAEIGKKARLLAEETYAWEQIGKQLGNIYSEVVGNFHKRSA